MALITSGITLDTVNQLGGIKGMWILGGTVSTYGPYVSPPTYLNPTLGATTLGASSIGGTGTWYYFALNKDITKLEDNETPSSDNGSLFYSGTLSTQFYHTSAVNDIVLQQLGQNRFIKAIILDSNNNYRALGFDRGMVLKSNKAQTGTKPGDMNGYQVVFEYNEVNPPYWLTTDITTAMKTGNFVVQPCTFNGGGN